MPSKPKTIIRPLIVIATVFSGATIGRPQMKIASELSTTTPTAVTGRSPEGWSREFRFASWRVRQREAPLIWNASSSISTRPLPSNAELHVASDRASVQFELATAAQNVATSANCLAQGHFVGVTETRGRVSVTTDITLPGFPRVDCDFAGTQPGTLSLGVADYVSQRDAGDSELNGHRWSIRSVNNLQSQRGSFPIARLGYEILAEGKVLGAVETWNVGKVWMSTNAGPQQQEEIALIAAALLQYTSLLEAQEE